MYQTNSDSSTGTDIICDDKCKILSFDQWDIIRTVDKTAVASLVCLFGIVSNIINLLVIVSQGFSDAMNVCLLGLTISDVCMLISLLWHYICTNPLLVTLVEPPYMPDEFAFMPAGTLRVLFSRITCYITIFITTQRCLCIAQPFKVKLMLTPERTGLALVAISVTAFFIHIFTITCTGVSRIGWKFFPQKNRTLIGLILADNWVRVYNTSTLINGICQFTSFVAIAFSTAILIFQLKQKTKWRDSERLKSFSRRDHKLGLMVALISTILLLCYIPSTCAIILMMCVPEFTNVKSPGIEFVLLWAFGSLCEAMNSSVNICVYYKVSTKYRKTFNSIMCTRLKHGQNMSTK